MDVSIYQCAILQYACEECFIGNNFVINFNERNGNQSLKGHCTHIDITFNWNFERDLLNFVVEFECRSCGNKETRKIINISNDKTANLNYICQCKEGNINIGLLFQEDTIDISDNNEREDNELKENNISDISKEKKEIIVNNPLYLDNNKRNINNLNNEKNEINVKESYSIFNEKNFDNNNQDSNNNENNKNFENNINII